MVDSDDNIILCRKIASKLWEIKRLMDVSGITDNLTVNISSTESPSVCFYNADWLLTQNIEKSLGDMIDSDTGEIIHPINYTQYTRDIDDRVVDVISYGE